MININDEITEEQLKNTVGDDPEFFYSGMIPTDIRDYIQIFSVFDDEFCNQMIKNLEKSRWKRHRYYNYIENKITSYPDDFFISDGMMLNENNEYYYPNEITVVYDELWNVIKRYLEVYNFPWYYSWSGYTKVRYNRYDENSKMRNHCDHIHSIFDGEMKGVPTLSILGALNNDYDGGELIFFNDQKIELHAGQVMVFPSNFLYPHSVNKITRGSRYSFVSWVW